MRPKIKMNIKCCDFPQLKYRFSDANLDEERYNKLKEEHPAIEKCGCMCHLDDHNIIHS